MKTKIVLFFVFLFSISFGQVTTLGTGMVTQAAAIVDPPPGVPNVIAFDYDILTGNQILRKYIYVASGVYKNAPKDDETVKTELLDSDIYDDIKYFPNPVVSELYVKWENTETNFVTNMELYSMTGQLIRSYMDLKNEEEITIDFQNFPTGYYNLILFYESGDKKNLRIIKKE